MSNNVLVRFFLGLLFPIYLFSQSVNNIEIKQIDEQLALQKQYILNIIKNINNKIYLKTDINQNKKNVKLLTSKIHINTSKNNTLAVKRDEVQLLILKQQASYENTLKNIIKGKQTFKDKEYFIKLLNNNIIELNKEILLPYTKTYENEKIKENIVSKQYTKNYIELQKQTNTQSFVLKYLLEHMYLYRQTNFFIDEFNLAYLISTIDSISFISYLSEFTSYYFNFTIGEIIIVLLIIFFIRILNTRIINIVAGFIAKIFIRKKYDDSEDIRAYLQKTIDRPLVLSLYIFSIHIAIHILIKDPTIIQQILPWINTIYISLLTWTLYSLLNNGINVYANTLLTKYPNVRKEMIIFILRIVKIILILLVILFLFSQLGIDIKAIAASLGVGGIAIALASKDTLANFFGSLNIMTDNSFSQGDWIQTNDVEGTVVDIRMRSTRIRTFDNAMITIPNSQLANTPIRNWSKRKIGRRIKMYLGITYESKMEDIIQLKKDLYDMLENHSKIASPKNIESTKTKKFEAIKKDDLSGVKKTLLVYIDKYNNSSIDILIYCFSKSPAWEDWLITKEDVLIKISSLVKKNNCSFAYPTQTIMLNKKLT